MTCFRHPNFSDSSYTHDRLKVFQLFLWPALGIIYSHDPATDLLIILMTCSRSPGYSHACSRYFNYSHDLLKVSIILMTCSSYPNYSPVPGLPVIPMTCSRYLNYSPVQDLSVILLLQVPQFFWCPANCIPIISKTCFSIPFLLMACY